MSQKKKVKKVEAPEAIESGGMYALVDFTYEYVEDMKGANDKVKQERRSISHKAGDVFVLPEGWQYDAAFEKQIHTKSKSRDGMVFVLPNGKRAVLPVKEA